MTDPRTSCIKGQAADGRSQRAGPRPKVTWLQRGHALTLSRQQSQARRRVLQERRRRHGVDVGLQGELGEGPSLLHLRQQASEQVNKRYLQSCSQPVTLQVCKQSDRKEPGSR